MKKKLEMKISDSYKQEVLARAAEILIANQTFGILNQEKFGKKTLVFIDEEPKVILYTLAGEGVTEGKKIYIGSNEEGE